MDLLGSVECMAIHILIVSNDDKKVIIYIYMFIIYYILIISLAAGRNFMSSFETIGMWMA